MLYSISCYDPNRFPQILGLTPESPELGRPMMTLLCETPSHAAEMYYKLLPLIQRLRVQMTMENNMIYFELHRSDTIITVFHFFHSFMYIHTQTVAHVGGILYSTIAWVPISPSV